MAFPRRDKTEPQVLDVLVVDDELLFGVLLVASLEQSGLICKAVADGWTALGLLADGWKIAVVVFDLRMPELDGLQFAEHLQRLPNQERPEIIFVSGHAGFEEAVQAIRLQARDLLTKPIDSVRLIQAVKSALLVRQMRQDGAPAADAPTADRNPTERRRATLESLRAVRKVRSQYFPSELFSDPSWEMLLDLYNALLAQQDVTVTSLAAASGAAMTTAWRRLAALRAHGLIENVEDPGDKRRIIVRLTPPGLKAVEDFFETYARKTES